MANNKVLEKALKDSIKKNGCTFGAKEVFTGAKNSKLIVVSQSLSNTNLQKINETAQKNDIPTINFQGSSVALGKLCSLQFRVSTVAFTELSEANITSIIKESKAA